MLKGATSSLKKMLGLELEVEFLELYKDQPLFGDICRQLSLSGFEFIDFMNLTRWERKAHNGFGHCIFGDALFLKSPEALKEAKMDVDRWSTYIAILMIYRRYDLIEATLALLDDEMRMKFSRFERAFRKVKNRNGMVKTIFIFLNRIFSMLGSSYRIHLIQ